DGARHPRCGRSGGLPAGKADRILRGLGQAGRHSGRAGRLTAENLAASPRQSRCAWSLSGTGRILDGSVSKRDRVPGPGTPPGPGVRSSRPRWPNGKVPAAGQLAGRTVYAPRAFRDRLAQGKWRARPPAMAGAAGTTKKVKMAQGTVKWFNGDKGYGFI